LVGTLVSVFPVLFAAAKATLTNPNEIIKIKISQIKRFL
jgi:hypothetical protein